MAGGITNNQAKYLAKLQRNAGIPYTGSGMTRWEASLEIDRVKQLLEDRRQRTLPSALAPESRTPQRQGA